MVIVSSDQQIRELHEQAAPSAEAFDLVWTHCRIVCRIAEQVAPPGVDLALVRAGALLHDIGVYRLAAGEHYVRHGVLGEQWLHGLELPDVLSRFCAHHTGVGVTRDDVVQQGLPLPVADYLADTPEEEIVMYADKFHSKGGTPGFVTAASFAASVARFGADKAAQFKRMVDRFGEPDLKALAEEFGHPIR
ncbi:HD domain-containing protein [Actinoplanes rectilineatus]|uniref:HD domain-containing protein n=1 Tax=Actinoplanes rectilineatus TaxID=113571 RepID=UPI000AFA5A46|nr:HD domain-containing protein [Actinoplanes rectilineatus]